jgi:nucleoside-triphosphatase THEP1
MRIEIIGEPKTGKTDVAVFIAKELATRGIDTNLVGVGVPEDSLARVQGTVEIIEKVETGIKIFKWVKRIFK